MRKIRRRRDPFTILTWWAWLFAVFAAFYVASEVIAVLRPMLEGLI
jgi:hypothetical protein